MSTPFFQEATREAFHGGDATKMSRRGVYCWEPSFEGHRATRFDPLVAALLGQAEHIHLPIFMVLRWWKRRKRSAEYSSNLPLEGISRFSVHTEMVVRIA